VITDKDIDTLARTIYGEARGESPEGRLLVAFVILNRWKTNYRRKDTIEQVCLDPWQFSCWNSNDPNREKLLAVDMSNQIFRQCYRAAIEAVDADNSLPIKTRHYYAMSMPEPPFWAAGHDPVKIHGHHKFYEGIA